MQSYYIFDSSFNDVCCYITITNYFRKSELSILIILTFLLRLVDWRRSRARGNQRIRFDRRLHRSRSSRWKYHFRIQRKREREVGTSGKIENRTHLVIRFKLRTKICFSCVAQNNFWPSHDPFLICCCSCTGKHQVPAGEGGRVGTASSDGRQPQEGQQG